MALFVKKNKIKLVLVGIFSFVLLIGWSSSVLASCSGYCGGFSDSQGCWCDTLAYDDYCSDICTYCCPSVTGCRECSTYADCNTSGWTCSGNAGNECKAYYPNSCPDGCMCSTNNYYFTEESCFDKGRQCPLTEISGTTCYYGRYCSGDACAFYYSNSTKPATYYPSGGTCYYSCSVTCTTNGWSRTGCSSATIDDGQTCTTDSCTSGGVTHTNITNNTQVAGCNGVCQACQGGSCDYATAGTDPGNHCTESYACSGACAETYTSGLCNASGNCAAGVTTNCLYGYACHPSYGRCYDWYKCNYTDVCWLDTYYSVRTCNSSGVCNIVQEDIGCCQGSKCTSGQYCELSTHLCTALPDCTTRVEDGFGYSDVCTNTDTSCGCTSCTNCNNSDGWYNSGSSFGCCDNKIYCTCQNQEYKDYSCSNYSCTPTVTDSQQIKTGCHCDETYCVADCDSTSDYDWTGTSCKYNCNTANCTFSSSCTTKCSSSYCLNGNYCYYSVGCSGTGGCSETQGNYCPSTKIDGNTCYHGTRSCNSAGTCSYSNPGTTDKPASYYPSEGNCYWNCSVTCTADNGWVRGTCSDGPATIADPYPCTTDSCTASGVTHSACECSTHSDCEASKCSGNSYRGCQRFYPQTCPDGCCCSGANSDYWADDTCKDQGSEICSGTCINGECCGDGTCHTSTLCPTCSPETCSTCPADCGCGDSSHWPCDCDWGYSSECESNCPICDSCFSSCQATCAASCKYVNYCRASGCYCTSNNNCGETPLCTCTLPWGGSIDNGQSETAYLASSVPCGSTCTSETRTCTDGTLLGTYQYQSCSPVSCSAYQTCVSGSCHNTRICSDTLSCPNDPTDTASCPATWYCVYNGTCYDSGPTDWDFITRPKGEQITGRTLTCYHHSTGDTGRWLNTDYYISYCTSKGWHWNVGSGDANVDDYYTDTVGASRTNYCYSEADGADIIASRDCCCGDDADENYRICDPTYEYIADVSCGTGVNAMACCDSGTDCVNDVGNCATAGTCYPFGGKYGFCHVTGNSWQDPDAAQSYCEHADCPSNYKWTKSGESIAFGGYSAGQTTEECCEDDSGEYKTTEQCPGATATSLCCSAPGKKIGPDNTCIDVCCYCTSGPCCDDCNFRPSTYVCRPAGTTYSADCDIEEKCDSFSATCPTDVYIADGTACTDDGDPCTNDICSAGACTHPSPLCSGTDTSCGCFLCSNCDEMDYLTNVGNPYTCCNGNYRCTSCQDQEYKDYYCSGTHCVYIITPQTLKSGCSECDPSTYSGCLNGECIVDQVSATESITINKPASIGASETGGSDVGSITISDTLNIAGTDTNPAYLIFGTEIIMAPGGQIFLATPVSGNPKAVIIKAGTSDNNANFGTVAGICAYYNNVTCELSGKYCYEGSCIGCHRGDKCPAGNYCRESDHSCQPVPDCQVRNETGYGTTKVTDNTQASGCNNVCQACQNGACDKATAQTDPGDNCTPVDCTKYLAGFLGGCCYRFYGSSSYNGNCNGLGQCYDVVTSCTALFLAPQLVGQSCCDSRCRKACPPGTYCPAGLCMYESISNKCYTSGQQGCPSGYRCDFGGICTIPF